MVTNYRIVVPSRKRSDNIKYLLKLIPNATIVVRNEELEDYFKVTPKEQLVSLPKDFTGGISKIRAWIMENFNEETIVFCDDDLKSLWCLVGSRARKYKDSEIIKQVIENSIQISRDFGLSLFYFNRDKKPWNFSCGEPIRFYGGFAGRLFGINGRKLKFDKSLTTREDLDITLQALLLDRIVYTDKRFYFDFGNTFSGDGGNQGIRNSDSELIDKQLILKKWGKCVEFDFIDKGFRKKRFTTGTKLLIERKSPI